MNGAVKPAGQPAAIPAVVLRGPFPSDAENCCRFAAADPAADLYVRLVDAPDTFYPCFFITRGGAGLAHPGVPLSVAAPLHPAIALIAKWDDASFGGWWTDNLKETCDALGLDADALAPRFPSETADAGRAIVQLLNVALEEAVAQRRNIFRAGEARLFAGAVVKALKTGDRSHLTSAKDHLGRIEAQDRPLVAAIAQVLVAHGLWHRDQLRNLMPPEHNAL